MEIQNISVCQNSISTMTRIWRENNEYNICQRDSRTIINKVTKNSEDRFTREINSELEERKEIESNGEILPNYWSNNVLMSISTSTKIMANYSYPKIF